MIYYFFSWYNNTDTCKKSSIKPWWCLRRSMNYPFILSVALCSKKFKLRSLLKRLSLRRSKGIKGRGKWRRSQKRNWEVTCIWLQLLRQMLISGVRIWILLRAFISSIFKEVNQKKLISKLKPHYQLIGRNNKDLQQIIHLSNSINLNLKNIILILWHSLPKYPSVAPSLPPLNKNYKSYSKMLLMKIGCLIVWSQRNNIFLKYHRPI